MTTESESRMREVLDRIFDYGIDRSILGAPCMFCGYKGEGYWQMGTHDERCPWRYVGGEFDRDQKLRDVVLSPPARRTSYEWVDRAGFTHRVRWGRWGPSANDGWRVEFWGDNGWSAPVPSSRELSVLAAAIATLAGLEKEEERSVPSVRSVLAKHDNCLRTGGLAMIDQPKPVEGWLARTLERATEAANRAPEWATSRQPGESACSASPFASVPPGPFLGQTRLAVQRALQSGEGEKG